MVSIDTTQESIVDSSSKIIKMAVARKDSLFQQDTVHVWQSLIEQQDKPLPLIYLANDLIQRSKIKGTTDFWLLFKPTLSPVLSKLMMRTTAIESQAILKVIEVWQNRQVYEEDFLQGLKDKI
jgi:regulator of Ty1 transposition protein 103